MQREPHATATLMAAAREAATVAYCPYSNYPVGAALLASDGRVFRGCNVENASFGLTICAERAAVASAVVAGVRSFVALALAAGTEAPATPCGACLQVLAEFCPPEMPVHFGTLAGGRVCTLPLHEFLPHAFRLGEAPGGTSSGTH
jgi:cytidine deaminase